MFTGKFPIVRGIIGLPRRCAADAWEEETQAERSSREERSGGPKGFAATRARVLPRETQRRTTLLAGFYFRSKANANSLGSSRGGAVERSETEGVALL